MEGEINERQGKTNIDKKHKEEKKMKNVWRQIRNKKRDWRISWKDRG